MPGTIIIIVHCCCYCTEQWPTLVTLFVLLFRITELEGQLSHSDTTNRTLRNDFDNRYNRLVDIMNIL